MDLTSSLNDLQNLNVMAIMHQKNEFLQLIEELRYCRNSSQNMEANIELLKSKKSKLDSEITCLLAKNQKLNKCCEELNGKLSSMCKASSVQGCENENRKLTMALEASELTIIDLKKSVMVYKSNINDLEKKLSEYEQKYLVAQQSSSLFCEKLEHFHKIVDKVNSRLKQVTDAQVRLDQNVEVATSLNVQYCNMQKNLEQVILDLKKDKEELKRQVVNLRSKLLTESLETGISAKEALLLKENKQLSDKNIVLNDLNSSLNTELNESKYHLKEANISLKQLHDLLNRDAMVKEQIQSDLPEITVKAEKIDDFHPV